MFPTAEIVKLVGQMLGAVITLAILLLFLYEIVQARSLSKAKQELMKLDSGITGPRPNRFELPWTSQDRTLNGKPVTPNSTCTVLSVPRMAKR